jgi:hypothetical protein
MDILLSYLPKSMLTSGVFVGYYWCFLRNKKINSFNRFYLLSALLISLGLPLLKVDWIGLGQGDLLGGSTLASGGRQDMWANAILVAVSFISAFLLIMLFAKVIRIYGLRRKYKVVKMDGFNFIETELPEAPFSFLNNLFWRKSISQNDQNGKKIFVHELTHIRQRHTYDKLLSQVVARIFWINPFYWILQREMNLVHEFLADEACLEAGDSTAFARMLLACHHAGKYLVPVHAFFQSSVSRRLNMIAVSGKLPFAMARRILVLPMVMAIVVLISDPANKAPLTQKQKDEQMAMGKRGFVRNVPLPITRQ